MTAKRAAAKTVAEPAPTIGVRALAAYAAGMSVESMTAANGGRGWNTPIINRAYGWCYRNAVPMNDRHQFAITPATRDAYVAYVRARAARAAANAAIPPTATATTAAPATTTRKPRAAKPSGGRARKIA